MERRSARRRLRDPSLLFRVPSLGPRRWVAAAAMARKITRHRDPWPHRLVYTVGCWQDSRGPAAACAASLLPVPPFPRRLHSSRSTTLLILHDGWCLCRALVVRSLQFRLLPGRAPPRRAGFVGLVASMTGMRTLHRHLHCVCLPLLSVPLLTYSDFECLSRRRLRSSSPSRALSRLYSCLRPPPHPFTQGTTSYDHCALLSLHPSPPIHLHLQREVPNR